jgi:hypothetical protein
MLAVVYYKVKDEKFNDILLSIKILRNTLSQNSIVGIHGPQSNK